MRRSLKAEFRKLWYQRSTWGLLVASALFAALSTVSSAAALKLAPEAAMANISLETQSAMEVVLGKATAAYLIALIIGIRIAAGEFRHSTAIATYLAQPHRSRVLGAKLIVGAAAGVAAQLIGFIFGVGAVQVYLLNTPHFSVSPGTYLRFLGVGLLSGIVMAIVGVAVGSLVRSVTAAITASLLWLLVGESLLVVFADWIGKWLITGAITAMFNLSIETPAVQFKDFLPPWGGVAMLLLYAGVFSTLAMFTTMRRDVD